MWYSETLWIIIRKGTGGDSLAVNDSESNDIRNNHVKHNSASRRHNCSNYGGFCRNLTCPESSGFHLNSYSLSKTKHGKIAIQVNTKNGYHCNCLDRSAFFDNIHLSKSI